MFFGNNEHGALKPARRKGDASAPTRQADHDIRAQVEREFSVMDQEHARIRAEALSSRVAHNREQGFMTKGKTA